MLWMNRTKDEQRERSERETRELRCILLPVAPVQEVFDCRRNDTKMILISCEKCKKGGKMKRKTVKM